MYICAMLPLPVLGGILLSLLPLSRCSQHVYDSSLAPTSRNCLLPSSALQSWSQNGFELPHILNIFQIYNTEILLLSNCNPIHVNRVPEAEWDLPVSIAGCEPNPIYNLYQTTADVPLARPFFKNDGFGQGITAYVLDTGIATNHTLLKGRATIGFSATGDNGYDKNGHGTHVAGTIAADIVGISRHSKLVAVQCLDGNGSGTISSILKGLAWIARFAAPNTSVVNMSVGAPGVSRILDSTVTALLSHGIVTVAAAGNEGQDACFSSPSSSRDAIVVAASDINYKRAGFSNYGPCVTIYAPGVDIWSLQHDALTSQCKMSGTSMAAPHVTAAVAALLSQHIPPRLVKPVLLRNAHANWISQRTKRQTPNLFLHVPSSLACS